MKAPDETAPLERARALLREGEHASTSVDWPASAEQAVALGWALKDACYEAWNSEPALAQRAAELLGELCEASDPPVLQALAHWARGIAALGTGRMADALAALDRAGTTFETLNDPEHAAQTQVPKLMALSVLGRHDEALQCGEATLDRFIRSGDERSAGKIELNLGTLLFRQDRHADAARHYRQAAVRFAHVRDLEHSIMADIGLANALTWQFEFDEALRINERARVRADSHGFTVLSAQARGAIGQLELNRGQAHRALPALDAARRLLEQAGGLPQQLAEAEISLADAYLAVNLLPEAIALCNSAEERCLAHQIPIERARALLQRAQARARLGHGPAAHIDLGLAASLFASEGNQASAALAALHQAAVTLQQGDGQLALRGAEAAAVAFIDAGIPGWHCEAEVLAAEACAAIGDNAGARRRFERALAAPGAAGHTDWRCRVGLASLARADGDLGAAQTLLERALSEIEAQQAALPGDELRTAFGVDKAAAYDLHIDLALEALDARCPADGGASEALWGAMERARSRALALGLAQRDVQAGPEVDALRRRLNWARDQQRLAAADADNDGVTSFSAQARTLERALLEAHRRAQLAAAAAADAAPLGDASLTLAALQAELAGDEAWVQYHLLGERWIAVVVTPGQVHWIRGDAAGLAQRLEALRFQLDAIRGKSPALQAHAAQLSERARRHLQMLHVQIWAPLQAAVGDAVRVFVAPHRSLHYVPFAALHDGRHWLTERHELCLTPGAPVWRAARRRGPPRFERLLALGVGGPTLPQVEAEVHAVAGHFGTDATLLLGPGATASALRALAPLADVVHLACHGQFRADSPYFSALALADGELTLYDAATMPLSASLVTLSACETGLSRVAPGDELIGLVRGFVLAGASSVLATLWAVDDASTAALMEDFYARLSQGGHPGAALRAAQCASAARGEHPFYWAAFALHGRA